MKKKKICGCKIIKQKSRNYSDESAFGMFYMVFPLIMCVLFSVLINVKIESKPLLYFAFGSTFLFTLIPLIFFLFRDNKEVIKFNLSNWEKILIN